MLWRTPLLGNCFWREGLEAAFGPERRGSKGGLFCSALAFEAVVSKEGSDFLFEIHAGC